MKFLTPLALGALALVLVGGLWLVISPFLLGTQPAGALWLPSTLNAVIVGGVLVLAATLGILLRVLLGVRDLVRAAQSPALVGAGHPVAAAVGGRGSPAAYPAAPTASGPRQPPSTLPPRPRPPAPYPPGGWEPYQPHGEEDDGHTHESARPAIPRPAGVFPTSE